MACVDVLFLLWVRNVSSKGVTPKKESMIIQLDSVPQALMLLYNVTAKGHWDSVDLFLHGQPDFFSIM